MVSSNTKVVQVTNIAPQATKDQMQTLFGYLGKIEDIRLYPTIRDVSCPVQSRICYVKFVDSATVGIAQHMTNTVFIDRALIVIPVINGDIPDEYYALEMTRNGTIVPGFNVNEPKLPPHVVNTFQGTGENKVVVTNDPQLVDNGSTPYPPLPAKYDSIKVEETRRTIQVCNIDPLIPPEEIIEFFSNAGEVKYLRICESPADASTHVLIEFTEQPSLVQAFKMNGDDFKGKSLEIIHATQPIIKPQAKSNEAAQKEIEEAMSRFKEAQNMINASIEPVIGMLTKDKRSSRRSRSRSHGRRRRSRSRSVSHGRRRRRSSSRSRKSRSKERRKRSKSRSLSSKRSKSSRRSRSRKRSPSKSPKRRSKNRSKERDSRARSRPKKSKTPERPRDKEGRTRERSSREKDSKTRDKSREKDSKTRERSRDKESKVRERSREKDTKVRGRSREKNSKTRDKSRDRQTRVREKSLDRDSSKVRERSRDRKRDKSRRSKEREPTRRSERKSREKEKSSRNSRDKKGEKESSIEGTISERKRSRSRSPSRRRSSSRDRIPRDRDRHRKRSRSKGKKRSLSPRKKKSRSRSGDRKKDRKEKKERRDKSRSRSKVRRNYDEEEKGFDTERMKELDYVNDKESS